MSTNAAVAYFQRGEAHYQNGNYGKAISDLTQAINSDPNYARAYCLRGLAHIGNRDANSAIADYSKAIQLDPKYVSAYKNRADAYRAIGDLEKALADFDTIIKKIDPTNVSVYLSHGIINAEMGKFDDAIADFSKVIDMGVKDVDVYLSRAHAYRENRDIENAVKDLEDAHILEPNNAEVNSFLKIAKEMQSAKNQLFGNK